MNNLLKAAALFAGGFLAGMIFVGDAADKGEVVYDGDDMYVKAEESKKCGWSYAKVVWKNPVK